MKNEARNLIDYIYNSPSPYHLVQITSIELEQNGYKYLCPSEKWNLKTGDKFYTTKDDQTIVAFEIGKNPNKFNIIAAHTDSPTFKIKPKHIIKKENYIKLNTEVYGAPIFNTWLDRPLSIAGCIIDKNLKKHIIKIDRPLLTIPNLCIHFNREINKGYEYNAQVDMLPILGLVNEEMEKENYLLNIIENETKLLAKDIMDFELFLYEYDKGCLLGAEEEFISSSRLDNAWMCFASLKALIRDEDKEDKIDVNGINMIALFSHEEIGSKTSSGANSSYLKDLLKRINIGLNCGEEEFYQKMNNSFVVSADLAHGVHPNKSELHDENNRPILSGGPVIKYSANQKYTTNAYSASVFMKACENAKVPYQTFTNRSDLPAGGTISTFVSSELGVPVVDMGAAILGMHSIRELGATIDNIYTIEAFKSFLNFS